MAALQAACLTSHERDSSADSPMAQLKVLASISFDRRPTASSASGSTTRRPARATRRCASIRTRDSKHSELHGPS
jgi:hypothetical protein